MSDRPIDYYIALIESHGLTVNCFGGNCPVQVHAYWPNGYHLYFRGRGQDWDIAIATNEDDAIAGDHRKDSILYYAEGQCNDAGYMPLCEVMAIVLDAIKAVENA